MTEQLVLLIILKMTLQMKGQTENISYLLVTIKTITVVLSSIKFCCFCVIPKIFSLISCTLDNNMIIVKYLQKTLS